MSDLLTSTRVLWRPELRQCTEWLARETTRTQTAGALLRIPSCPDRVRGAAVDAVERAVRSGVVRAAAVCRHDGGLAIAVSVLGADSAMALGARVKWAVADAGVGVGIALMDQVLDTPDAIAKLEVDANRAGLTAAPGQLLDASSISDADAPDVSRALATGEMAVWYQPVVEIDSARVIGARALASSTESGNQRFWSISEDATVDGELAAWVMRAAVAECQTLLAPDAPAFQLTVPVTPRQLDDAHFTDVLVDCLAGIDATRLQMALVDAGVRELSARSVGALRLSQGMGVKLALDEFGSGMQSLTRLASYDWDAVFVSRALVHRCSTRRRSAIAASAAVSAAVSAGAKCVLDGVEFSEDAAMLVGHGASFGSGPLWSRPVGFWTLHRAIL